MPTALWITGKNMSALRPEELPAGNDLVEVETLFSGISRGTESLVFLGAVPESERERMRCPNQAGDFPFPVKYGYSNVGRIKTGPRAGEIAFCLFPHQDRFAVPDTDLVTLPANLPPARAVLAANMETALNIVWDARAAPGDRIAVIGAGVVGALCAWLCHRIPGAEVTLADVNAARRVLAERLAVPFASRPPADCDIAIHASASEAGLQSALDCAGREARIVEASWYGDRRAELSLGANFHAGRLKLVSSQVGSIPAARAARWDFRRRLSKALDLLASDQSLDALISGTSEFAMLDRDYSKILADPATLCHRISYPQASEGH
ncbi:zinc-binding alcohol dehydrogenase [Aliihoeflea sp. 40Bstr573]|uniref:zinc-dependent alcohol dehydrogenase n=1 Tax=Aliihoeflea sp. 40Bstr573 TaxID=2696467 RepID=UPI0020953963|nr:zinc-binding alcohol dehydrogenase [Aliihoeflea sp. 40Bstr573]MCO6386918.1 dehydrogenase [Aliihoeflea sp. 40Bstr573]